MDKYGHEVLGALKQDLQQRIEVALQEPNQPYSENLAWLTMGNFKEFISQHHYFQSFNIGAVEDWLDSDQGENLQKMLVDHYEALAYERANMGHHF